MRTRDDSGETLAEVLVSTALLGIIGIGIIGAIASVLISTDIDRRVSASETVLRSYVAAIEGTSYEDCASAGSYSPAAVGYSTMPNTFEASVTGVSFQNSTSPSTRPIVPPSTVPLTFPNSTCPGNVDPGLQLIAVEVKSTGSHPTTERITFVKRKVAP
jgi:type II secretory pathway pseudopilin PulG